VVLVFVAYELWGTGFSESHSQAELRHQISNQLKPSSIPAAPVVFAPAEGKAVGTIAIPKIGVNKAIVEGTSPADLHEGPGHYLGTPMPGHPGNVAIAGHRTTYGAPFSNLDELAAGDPVIITTPEGVFSYRVTHSTVVAPSDIAVLDPIAANEVTLTTCTPRFTATRRLIVQALLEGPPVPSVAAPPGAPAPSDVRALTQNGSE
jgi:sortase A